MLKFVTVALSLLLALPSYAGQFVTHGDYTIHYNTMNTTMLQPEVAKTYGITRSKNRALLNISVRKKGSDDTAMDVAVAAKVTAQAVNLNQQLKSIDMKEMKESGAIYYIGVFSIADKETLNFTVSVDPESAGKPYEVTFKQQFFLD